MYDIESQIVDIASPETAESLSRLMETIKLETLTVERVMKAFYQIDE